MNERMDGYVEERMSGWMAGRMYNWMEITTILSGLVRKALASH